MFQITKFKLDLNLLLDYLRYHHMTVILRHMVFIYSFRTDLPKNTFPFLLLGMAPPAAPVAFCNKQQETSYNKA